MTLRLSVEQTAGAAPDLRSLVDPSVDPGVPGGRELIDLGGRAASQAASTDDVRRVSDALGEAAAMSAIELVAGFEMVNRAMEATGQPVDPRKIERCRTPLRTLGAFEFPHAADVRPSKGNADRLTARLRRRLKRP